MPSVSGSETAPERGWKAAPAPLLPAGGIISTSFSSWVRITTTSLLLHTRKLLQVSGLKGFLPSLDRYIKKRQSWGTGGGKSKEQMLGGHSRSGQGPGFTKMVTAHVQVLVREDFGKGIREFLSQPSGSIFQGLQSNEVSKRKKIQTSLWQGYGE